MSSVAPSGGVVLLRVTPAGVAQVPSSAPAGAVVFNGWFDVIRRGRSA